MLGWIFAFFAISSSFLSVAFISASSCDVRYLFCASRQLVLVLCISFLFPLVHAFWNSFRAAFSLLFS